MSELKCTREIGVLQVLGAMRQQVSRMVQVKALFIHAFSIIFDLLDGLYLGSLFSGKMDVVGFLLD